MLQINYSRSGTPATIAELKSDLKQIRIKVDGKVQRVFSATELITINSGVGIVAKAGRLQIFFAEPWRRTMQGEDALAWGTADISTFQVEIDIDGAAVSPALSADVNVTRQNTPMGPIVKWRRQNVPVTATGITNTTTLDKTNAYYKIHAFSTDIDNIAVLIDQERIVESSVAGLNDYYEANGLIPDANDTLIAFDPTMRIGDSLAMRDEAGKPVSEFRIEWDMAAANSFNIISEILGARD